LFLSSASFDATYFTLAGSFNLPLNGSGDKYGQSVSMRILSIGILAAVSWALLAFLKVKGPANEI
jgi:hypothetical protein